MELTQEQIKIIEDAFESDISELSNFTITSFFSKDLGVLPDFEHKIGKYFKKDEVRSITYDEYRKDARFDRYIIKADTKEKAIIKYNKYIETQYKIMQAIIDINSDLYKAVEGDFQLHAEAKIADYETKFEYMIKKLDNKIYIQPITIISIDL